MSNNYKNIVMMALLAVTTTGFLLMPAEASAQNLMQKAQAGDADARYRVAANYYSGKGVQQDMGQAFAFARQAAAQGHAGAQAMLGIMYAQGTGVEQDDYEAAHWYEQAADQGDVDSQYMMGIYYATGAGVDLSFVDAAKWFAKVAEQGDARGLTQLGYLFKTGQGVTESKVIAFALLTLSQANDPSASNKAVDFRKDLVAGMSPAQMEAGKQLSYELIKPNNFTNALKKAYSAL